VCVGRIGRLPRPACHVLTYLTGRPAVCYGVQCCPSVRVSCRSPNSTSPTRANRGGHPREDHREDVTTRGCHDDATRKPFPWNSGFSTPRARPLDQHRRGAVVLAGSLRLHPASLHLQQPATTVGATHRHDQQRAQHRQQHARNHLQRPHRRTWHRNAEIIS